MSQIPKPLIYAALVSMGILVGLDEPSFVRWARESTALPTGLHQALTPTQVQEDLHRVFLYNQVAHIITEDYVDPTDPVAVSHRALSAMLSGLDPHSGYLTPSDYRALQAETRGSFAGVGIEISPAQDALRVMEPIPGGPAAKAGVLAGDLVVAVDGHSLRGQTLQGAMDLLRGPIGTPVSISIKRSEHVRDVLITRAIIHPVTVTTHIIGHVGVVRLSVFDGDAAEHVRTAVEHMHHTAETDGHPLTGWVLDLRNNPGGLLDAAVGVANVFLDGGSVVSTRGRHSRDTQTLNSDHTDSIPGIPLAVLINGNSASASEIVAGALQDAHRAVVVGTRSFGKGSVQTISPLPDGGGVRLTTARYYTPSGRSIQGLGITPDVVVREDRGPEPKDQIREAALQGALANPAPGQTPWTPRTDLPAAFKSIPELPPVGAPPFDPEKLDTDYQLQQAVNVVSAMVVAPPKSSVIAGP